MSDTRQPGGDKRRAIAPWLRDVPLPPRPALPAPAAPAAPAAGNSALPDWLRELQSSPGNEASASPTDAGEQPAMDWLSGSDTPAAPATATPEPDQPMPDWLRELASSMPEDEAPPPPPPSPTPRPTPRVEGATSWLESMAHPADASPPATPEPPKPARPLKRMPSGATDWLRSLGQEPDPQAEPPRPANPPRELQRPARAAPPPDDGIPSWLSDISEEELARDLAASAEEPAAQEASGSTSDDDADLEMPSWLTASDEQSDTPPATRSEPAMPLWLRDAAGEREESDAERGTSAARDQNEDEGDIAIPDWLRTVRDDDTPDSTAGAAPDASIPSWLQGTTPEPPEVVEPTTPSWLDSAAASPNDVPTWMRNAAHDDAPETTVGDAGPPLFQSDAPTKTNAPAEADESDHLPSWLRSEEAPAAQQPALNDAQDIPLWMRSNASNAPSARNDAAAPSSTESTPDEDADDVPPWLRGTDDEPALVSPPVPGDANLPTWLRGTDERGSTPVEPAPQPTSPSDDAALPPWLLDTDDPEGTSAPAPTEPATKSVGGDFLGGSDLPGWLRPQEAEGGIVSVPAAPRSSDWLERLRAQEAEAEAEGPDSEIATTIAVARPTFSRTPAQLEAISLLQRLVATPFPAPAAQPVAEPRPAWRRVRAEQVLYLLLLLALLAGLLVPSLSAPLAGANGASEAATIATINDGLNERSRVLVAYEWDTRRRSELAPLEQTVIDHLARRGVKFVFVSTDVQGTLLSFDARDRLVDPANGYGYRPGGRDYILLGYRPGGELALRALAQDLPGVLRSDFQGQDATQSAVASDVQTGQPLLTSLNDFAQIVVMADDPQDVQGWMEQVHSQAPNVPVVLLLPEETTPIVQPYLRQPNIFYLAGKSGALAYNQVRGGAAGATAAATSGQLSYAVVAFIVLALVGALVGALAGRRGAA